eukprot:scaffold309682_cov13-Tisochrysis_lutea.AAC.1
MAFKDSVLEAEWRVWSFWTDLKAEGLAVALAYGRWGLKYGAAGDPMRFDGAWCRPVHASWSCGLLLLGRGSVTLYAFVHE